MKSSIWKCKDGRVVPIKDMTTDHIINSMRMLERMHEQTQFDMPYPAFQGEMAQMYAEQEFDNYMEMSVEDVFPVYAHLEKELLKRTKIREKHL